MPVFRKHNLIFIHIPKTMGTSVNAWFGCKGDNSEPDLELLYGQHKGRQLQHLKYKEIQVMVEQAFISKCYFLAIIRCPRQRLVSEYRWLKNHSFWGSHLRAHLRSFRDFLQHLEQLYDSGKLLDSFVHWHPQILFIKELLQNPKLCLIRFEETAERLAYLNVELGWNISGQVTHLNAATLPFEPNLEDMIYLDHIVYKIYQEDDRLYKAL